MSNPDPVRLTRLYIWVVGAGLLLDAALLIVLNALGDATDLAQTLLHAVWGVGLLAVSFLARNGRDLRAVWAAVIFGVFYVALGITGLTFTDPFGLKLGAGENAFHLAVGTIALVLGAWALRTIGTSSGPLQSATRPAEVRNVTAARRRARHRPGKARARARRH